MSKKRKPLTWDQLADEYDKAGGGRKARTLPMDHVFKWAVKQTDKFVVKEGYLYKVYKV